MHRLEFITQYDGKIKISNRFPFEFIVNTTVNRIQIEQVYNFAYDMTFGGKGEHRSTRSGGQEERDNIQKFKDTLQGKLSEYAIFNYFNKQGITSTEPDLTLMPLGKWDKFDLIVNNNLISVKSTKGRGTLLLLETKDYDTNGRYISVQKGELPVSYDYYCLIRMQQKRDINSYGQQNLSIKNFENFMKYQFFSFNVAGFISRFNFVNNIIAKEMIIPRGYYINDRIKMDADNYYCQAIDLMPPNEFIRVLSSS